MFRRLALARRDFSEELIASIIRAIFVTLMMEAIRSSETSVLTRATWHNIPEGGILHSHRRENLKCYTKVPVHSGGSLSLPSISASVLLTRLQQFQMCRTVSTTTSGNRFSGHDIEIGPQLSIAKSEDHS
jgi:hypothetical protein